jgi:6-phosphogluconate dehydrogenase
MQLEFGVIGLGRIGGGLAYQALKKGMRVVGRDVAPASDELRSLGLIEAASLADLAANLSTPRIIFVYIHAGPPIDAMLDDLCKVLSPGDVIVDGGNSYWGDSVRRQKRLHDRGFHLVDLGTSGGVGGARNGACFMAGGLPPAVEEVEPILKELCIEGGYVYAGGPGSGHYVKLVHNGIEFGMLQAIGEGIDLLEKFDSPLPVGDVISCWRNGSVIRSWLIDLMHEAYLDKGGMENVPAYIEDTGEVNWLVGDAMRMEVPIPVIAQSVMQLFASRDDRKEWSKAIAMMRHGFGGHPYGPNDSIRHERVTSRVGDIYRPGEDES